MIFNMSGGGGGGGGLNFAVIGGLTQPTSPRENTIWVKTETSIPSWAFSPTEPTNPEGGTVFFRTALTSSAGFNALRKNEIAVLPTAAQQYISGQWKNMEAHAYIGGTWVQFSWTWAGQLYDRGTTYIAGVPKQIDSDGNKPVVVRLESNRIYIDLQGGVKNIAGFPNTVNYTPYNTMKATVSVAKRWTYAAKFQFGVDSSNRSSVYASQAVTGNDAGAEFTISLDISAYNNSKAPWFGLYNDTGMGEVNAVYVHKIWLE